MTCLVFLPANPLRPQVLWRSSLWTAGRFGSPSPSSFSVICALVYHGLVRFLCRFLVIFIVRLECKLTWRYGERFALLFRFQIHYG